MARLSLINTCAPVPTGLMVVAGLATPFVPIVLLIPALMLFETNGEGLPFRAEIFLTFGALPGLIVMLPALILAHQANRRGWNGWGPALVCGALFGLITGLVWDAGRLGEFTVRCILMGLLYGGVFWALCHGLATFASRKAARA